VDRDRRPVYLRSKMAPISLAQDVRTWAPAASALFAFLAATASWASIRIARRQWLAAQRPYLVGQLMKDPSGRRRLEIRNTGSGGAHGVRFCVVVGDEYVTGYAGPSMGGYLGTDETAVVETALHEDGPPETFGVVACWDASDRVHVSGLDSAASRVVRRAWFRRKDADATDPESAFAHRYGWKASAGRTKVAGVGKAKLPAGMTFRAQ
jgi:hypothetical protein